MPMYSTAAWAGQEKGGGGQARRPHGRAARGSRAIGNFVDIVGNNLHYIRVTRYS